MQAGLELALEHGLTQVSAGLYQRLSVVLCDPADYRRAQRALDTALDLCRGGDQPVTEVLRVTCLIGVLRECGEWSRAMTIGRELIAEDRATWVAQGLIGPIHGFPGRFGSGRRPLPRGSRPHPGSTTST